MKKCPHCRKIILPPHGTRTRYNKGCRCRKCRKANADYWSSWSRLKEAA